MTRAQINIPSHWTADEALSVAYFLQNILVAIWDMHGKSMSEELQVCFNHGVLSAFPSPPHDDNSDSEEPF